METDVLSGHTFCPISLAVSLSGILTTRAQMADAWFRAAAPYQRDNSLEESEHQS